MVNLERLGERGLRAYELGRLRMAARIGWLLVPLAALCLVETRGREACGCCAAVLLALAVGLRFRDRAGVDSVTSGLAAGTVPLALALVLSRIDPDCASAGLWSSCTAFSVLAGIGAGALAAVRERRLGSRAISVVTAGAVAALAASLGCVRLGAFSVAGVVAGIAVGAIAAPRPRRAVT